jgi:general secretion pathway protein G
MRKMMMKHTGSLLVVVILIAFLCASCSRPHSHAAMVPATRATLEAFAMALELYSKDCGSYPQAEQGLRVLIENPGVTNWAGPYIRGARVPPDAWGTPVAYLPTQRAVTLLSAGSDITFGTADDVVKIIEHGVAAYRR